MSVVRLIPPALGGLLALACAMTAPSGEPTSLVPRNAPFVDYHQHLVSPAFEPIVKQPKRDGAALVRELDEAGIDQAVALSVGYSFADERKNLPDPDKLTQEENNWLAAEVAKHPTRLIGFCSANILRAVALHEIERCLGLPQMTGIKLHLGNNGVTLRDAAHVIRLREVFALAQRLRVPVLTHMRPRGGANYGAQDVETFLDRVLPVAPDVEVIVAHLGTSGPGYGAQTDEIMAAFGAAAERKHPSLGNVYFEVATNVTADIPAAEADSVAKRLRQVGIDRVLYGSDLTPPGGSVRAGWEIFRTKVPLTPAEMQRIANNRPRFVTAKK